MFSTRVRSVAQRHFSWVLWLVLLLPLAQAVATGHVYSHVDALNIAAKTAGQSAPRHALHQAPCDLCLTAAAISGAAPLAAAPALPFVAAHHDVPPAQPVADWQPQRVRAYLSRAPPTSTL